MCRQDAAPHKPVGILACSYVLPRRSKFVFSFVGDLNPDNCLVVGIRSHPHVRERTETNPTTQKECAESGE